jgi:hypothetical protein
MNWATPSTWDLYMEKVWECLKCRIELGTESTTSIKRNHSLEDTYGIIDQMPLNNGYSTSFMVELISSSFRDLLLTSVSKYGLELPGYLLQFIWLVQCLVKENMITMPMTISISVIEMSQLAPSNCSMNNNYLKRLLSFMYYFSNSY